MTSRKSFQVGDQLVGPVRGITMERIEWYDSAMLSAATNELRQVGSNIHTDPEFAISEGFSGMNADGMISANWCSEMMIAHFGMDYIERGELRTKFIRPVNLDVLLHVKGRVREATPQPNGRLQYVIDIWCEDAEGLKLVEGDAKVEVPAH